MSEKSVMSCNLYAVKAFYEKLLIGLRAINLFDDIMYVKRDIKDNLFLVDFFVSRHLIRATFFILAFRDI